ncbi:amidohydrolase family protein [Fusibacter paucivorans]|uniref:Amidohydrolase family protein n=1 Tax=Fusibacter paucivorans TaxID=76009 RepID=A0ABS5PP62_9FIRM|nr:amidohydrolase family protein [Fusibacter paucivorans]MBS7526958.1 amidohydrolase family protein [Fusibacter paucivorans]
MYFELRRITDTIPIVDDHAHVGITQAVSELGAQIKPLLPASDVYLPPAQSSFGFPYLEALHEEAYVNYYGFVPEDLNQASQYKKLAAAYDAKRRDLKQTFNDFMKMGNVEHVISNLFLPEALKNENNISLIPMIDPLMYPFGDYFITDRPMAKPYVLSFGHILSEMKRAYGVCDEPSYMEYMALVDRVLDDYKSKGYKGYKIISAYVRSLHFEKPLESGEILYEAARGGDADSYRAFQDFIVWKVMEKSAQNGMPVQLHTALIDGHIDVTDPMNLSDFLKDETTYNAKIVLLHAGYPMFDNAKMMAMASKPLTVNNVYIDISGRVMFANHPAIIAKMLRNFLEVPALWKKILYGSDTLLGERFLFTCAKTGRKAVYLALAGMIDEGIISESMAVQIAKDILRNNAIRLYQLPLEIM